VESNNFCDDFTGRSSPNVDLDEFTLFTFLFFQLITNTSPARRRFIQLFTSHLASGDNVLIWMDGHRNDVFLVQIEEILSIFC
jgi:hypothetical protein